jgi:[acyl-carrier-protein] S-malonyltransferase
MAQVFAAAGNAAKPQRLAFPYVPNRTGRISREPGLVMELLVEQIDHPVLWRTSVLHLLEAGYRKAVEFGPGKVLANLAKRIPSPEGATLQTLGVSDAATLKTLEAFQK